MIMIRVIKQYGISILLLIVAIFCLLNIGFNITDSFTVITNSLAIFLAIFYFVNFEKDIIIKIKSFVLNIKWPFHGKSKKILNNLLNFIIEKRWDIISYLFLFLLFLITLGEFSFLEKFINLSWINKYQVILTVLAILSGGLTFWHNRERVEKEIDQEQIAEQGAEDKRKADFASKFPRINKVPVLRNLVRWMYKEGWGYSIPLVLITLIFIAIKIGMPIVYTGSYIDEYNHVFSGIDFFESGNFFEKYEGEVYFKGAYVSILVGLLMFVFGKKIFIAKMLPVIIGIFNFYLLYQIGRKIFKNKLFILGFLIIYTISPFIIFSHFYIRFYVFYELAFLLLFFTFLNLRDNIKKNKVNIFLKNLFAIFVINLIIFFGSEKDIHRYIILFATLFLLTFLFLWEIKLLKSKNILLNKISGIDIKIKIFILLIISLFSWYAFNINALVLGLLSDNNYHGSKTVSTYFKLFFHDYLILTIFFIFSLGLMFFKKINIYLKLLIFLTISLFAAHLISKPEQQLIRGIIYLLPTFYLFSVLTFSMFNKIFNKKVLFVVFFLMIVSILKSYPENFTKGPYIKGEVNYVEYKKVANFLEKECKNKNIIALIHDPYILDFYNIAVDYTSYINKDLLLLDKRYRQDAKGNYKTTYKNIPTITAKQNLLESFNNGCIIITEDSQHYVRYYDKDDINILEKNYKKIQFYSNDYILNIYY